MFGYLNQVYMARNPNASYAPEEPMISQAPVYGPPPPPPMIGPPAPPPPAPEPVGPQFSAMPPAGPVASVQPEAPPPPPPPQQQGPAPQGPQMQTHDTSIGVQVAPMQTQVLGSPGRAAGNLNTMTPERLAFLQSGTNIEADAYGRTADRVSGAMVEQRAPLDERAQYLTALAEREARDQGGRNEQNRQRLEDYEKEAKELRDMKPDPGAYMKSGQGIMDMIATVFGGIGQGYMRKAGDLGAENMGAKLAAGNRARFDAAQGQAIANKRGYLEDVRRGMLAQRDMQNDQVASNQRESALRKEATGAKLDKAGIGVAIQEAVSRGDMGQAQALMKLAERQADAQKYVAAQGGSQMVRVSLPDGTMSLPMPMAQAVKYQLERGGKVTDAGLTMGINSAKAEADGKEGRKASNDAEKRFVPTDANGQGYLAGSAEEAKDHREGRAAASTYVETLQKMQKLRGEIGSHELALAKTGIRTDKVKELEALQGVATGQFNKMNKFGALDKGTVELIDRTMGNATDFADPTARYKTLISGVNADLESKARAGSGFVRPNMPSSFKPVGK